MLKVFKQLLLQEIVVSSANSINDSNLLLFQCHLYIAEKDLVQGSILVGHLSLWGHFFWSNSIIFHNLFSISQTIFKPMLR